MIEHAARILPGLSFDTPLAPRRPNDLWWAAIEENSQLSPRRLPPLNALRVFEAAGRLHSFSKAAAELHVTPGAVSRQIANLETFLGTKLFQRIGSEVRLTEAGQRFLAPVQESLERLRLATRDVMEHRDRQPLHIFGSRFFIRIWLLPRLPAFQALHPEQEVRITTALPEDPMPPEIDVGILAGDGRWPGMRAHRLIERIVTPACSPDYLRHAPPLRVPADLEHHTLLHTARDAPDWQRWYDQTGAPPAPLPRRIGFTSSDIAYSAALDGIGLVLGRRGFIEADLQSGRLLLPFTTELRGEGAFYLMYRDRTPLDRRIALFRDWMLDQLAG